MATTKRDYYDVLGVARDVDADQLKKVYRKLAMEFHPDRNQDDPSAEVKFKEVGEAYAVLSDPQKRQQYDTYGHVPDGMNSPGGFSFDSAFDLFDMFFGGSGRRRGSSGPQRGSDLTMRVEVTLQEVVFGATRTIEVPRAGTCTACDGSGATPGTSATTCKDCGGAGQVQHARNSIFGQLVQVATCQPCRGQGRIIESPCTTCRGQGLVETRKTLEVTIPAGVDEDVNVRVSGEGEAGPRGGPSGDLFIGFRVQPHPDLTRSGDDLIYELPVSVPQAVLGDRITIPTVSGEHEMELPAGTQNGRVIKVAGLGVPHLRTGRRGDQLCVVRVVIPTHLKAPERSSYEALGDRTGRPAEVKRGFFDHLRSAFRG
jgi:molecular chaperone DnaJ